MSFYANYLLRRHFAKNAEPTCETFKKKKIFQKVVCRNFFSACSALHMGYDTSVCYFIFVLYCRKEIKPQISIPTSNKIYFPWDHCTHSGILENRVPLTSEIGAYANRKEGNDQESIQLPNTFRPRHQRTRRTHLKQRHRNQTLQSKKSP